MNELAILRRQGLILEKAVVGHNLIGLIIKLTNRFATSLTESAFLPNTFF
jgi:hypothetical protein